GKAPARLDFKKLDSVNAHFVSGADDARLAALVFAYIANHTDWAVSPESHNRVQRAIPLLKKRAKTIKELAEQSRFLVAARPLIVDDVAKAQLKDDVKARLRRLRDRLAAAPQWDHEALGAMLKAFATDEGVGLGQIGPGVRAALTGGTPAPDL